MKYRYLDPKIRLSFKRVFGGNLELPIDFLNALTPFEKNQHIESLKYLPLEQTPETPRAIPLRTSAVRTIAGVGMQMNFTYTFYKIK